MMLLFTSTYFALKGNDMSRKKANKMPFQLRPCVRCWMIGYRKEDEALSDPPKTKVGFTTYYYGPDGLMSLLTIYFMGDVLRTYVSE